MIDQPDRLLTGVSKDGRLRGRAATTTGLVHEALSRHRPGLLGAEALARALSATAVFPATWKDCARVSIQWSGQGPLRTVVTEIRVDGSVRGYVSEPQAGEPVLRPGGRGLGHCIRPGGFVGVIRQEAKGPFTRGQVELTSGELDEDLEKFFEISDQVPTRVRSLGSTWGDEPGAHGAILVQALPDDMPAELVGGGDLLSVSADATPEEMLAVALGPGYDVLDERPLLFRCQCERERIEAGIALLEVDELLDMINEDQGASVRCDFCGEVYEFSREDLEAVMVRKVTGDGEE